MARLIKVPFGLYLIITDPLVAPETLAELAVRDGVALLQLRLKNKPTAELLTLAARIASITKGSETLFIVNDDVRIAAAADADGVHLGQDDMPIEEARRIWATDGKIFGMSTHDEAQAQRAAALAPDYIGVGPVHPTPTKAIPDPVLGVQRMGAIIRGTKPPSVAIGGINTTNLRSVLEAGAENFAVVREVNCSSRPAEVIAELHRIWREHLESRGELSHTS